MVYCGMYPADGSKYPDLRDALEKLQLNDASLNYEPETSVSKKSYIISFRGSSYFSNALVPSIYSMLRYFPLHGDSAYERGRRMCEKLKDEIPRHLYENIIQYHLSSNFNTLINAFWGITTLPIWRIRFFEPARLVKLDILINREEVDALSFIVHGDSASPLVLYTL